MTDYQVSTMHQGWWVVIYAPYKTCIPSLFVYAPIRSYVVRFLASGRLKFVEGE
jgi:hypothetical protein